MTSPLELRLLQSFVAVAEELHFGRAARRLHLSQPPLSLHIRRLEEDLGARLFERTNKRVALTEPGRALLGRARALLADAELTRALVSRVAAGASGTLAIGYTPTATYEILPPLVRRARRELPELALDLHELTSAAQVAALRAGRIELGFLCLPVAALAEPGPALRVTPLTREPFIVALPRAHPLAKRPRVTVKDLDGEALVGVRGDVEPGWAAAGFAALQAAGVELTVAQVADSKLAMLGLVAAGLGVAIASRSMRALGRRGVVFRPLVGTRATVVLALATCEPPSPRAAALAALLRGLGDYPPG